jgi:hypothetical protein
MPGEHTPFGIDPRKARCGIDEILAKHTGSCCKQRGKVARERGESHRGNFRTANLHRKKTQRFDEAAVIPKNFTTICDWMIRRRCALNPPSQVVLTRAELELLIGQEAVATLWELPQALEVVRVDGHPTLPPVWLATVGLRRYVAGGGIERSQLGFHVDSDHCTVMPQPFGP